MKIAFHKSGESHDRIYVNRDDGTEAGWRWPAGGPPHDLMHYAVETALGIENGFWGLVLAGANFDFATAHVRTDPATRTLDDVEARGLIAAEAVVAAVTTAITVEGMTPAGALASIDPGERPDARAFEAACREAAAWLARWRELSAGETLVVEYPAA